jgi:hypothetical protein
VKWRVAGLSLTARSGSRALLLACLIAAVRHVVAPRPWIGARLAALLRRLTTRRIFDVDRVARALEVALAGLAAQVLLVDLIGGSTPSPGRVAIAFGAVLLVRQTVARGGPSLASSLRRRAAATAWRFEWPAKSAFLWALLLFSATTALVLRQQVLAYTSVPDRGDPLFSMWRIAWVAHELPLDPRHLFDANIFHPAARTLAYSDAMLVPALIGAPALWLGAPVAAVYTSLLLCSYVAAGLSMFVLANAVTRHAGAASIAGLIFAFDTFRFLHYPHLELQFTFAAPLALLFVLRTLATGSRKDGALAGLFVAVQTLCSIYYGMYLTVSLATFVVCWFVLVKRIEARAAASLGLGAAIAILVCAPVSIPYWANRTTVGERGADEIRSYSASGRDYLTAYRQSAVYGLRLWAANDAERKLFPGTVPLVLAAAAFWPHVGPLVAPAAATLAMSVDASLGLHGTFYTAF